MLIVDGGNVNISLNILNMNVIPRCESKNPVVSHFK